MDLSLLGMLSAAGGGSLSSKKADGNPVVLDGLQGGVPFNRVEVSGKNLIQFPYYDGTSKTFNGITYTVNSDGSVTVNGTATADSVFYFSRNYKFKGTNTDLFLSGCPNNGSGNTYDLVIAGLDISNNVTYVNNDVGIGKSINIPSDTVTINVYIRIRSKQAVENLVFRPQLELGDTATEYEPPITGSELTVGVSGKNLVQYPYIGQKSQAEGITMVDNGDGSVTVNGVCDTIDATFYMQPITLLPDTDYVLSGCPVGGSTAGYRIQFADNNWSKIFADFGSGAKIRVDKKMTFHMFRIIIAKGTVCNNLVFRPQLELGDTATDYEPYHGAEYTITPDSNPYTVPVNITQYDDINVLSIVDDSSTIISVNANKASEQLSKIYSSLNNKPVLLFDGNIPTYSMDGYAEFTVDKEYSAFMIVPICNDSNVHEPGACTVIPIGYATEEEQGFTVYGYPRSLQRVTRAFIKRVGDAFYVRSSSTACGYMTIYGI